MNSTEETRKHAFDILNLLEVVVNHDQSEVLNGWNEENHCGSTMCVAGASIYLKGQAYWNAEREAWERSEEPGRLLITPVPRPVPRPGSGSPYEDITWWARKAKENLGLSKEEAHYLFYDTENHEAKAALRRISEGKPLTF